MLDMAPFAERIHLKPLQEYDINVEAASSLVLTLITFGLSAASPHAIKVNAERMPPQDLCHFLRLFVH